MPGNTRKQEMAQREKDWEKKKQKDTSAKEKVANEGETVTETRLMFSTEVRISEIKAISWLLNFAVRYNEIIH